MKEINYVKVFNSIADIRQEIIDSMPPEPELYGKTYDELLEYATQNFANYLRGQEWFKYGEWLAEGWDDELTANDCAILYSFFE